MNQANTIQNDHVYFHFKQIGSMAYQNTCSVLVPIQYIVRYLNQAMLSHADLPERPEQVVTRKHRAATSGLLKHENSHRHYSQKWISPGWKTAMGTE